MVGWRFHEDEAFPGAAGGGVGPAKTFERRKTQGAVPPHLRPYAWQCVPLLWPPDHRIDRTPTLGYCTFLAWLCFREGGGDDADDDIGIVLLMSSRRDQTRHRPIYSAARSLDRSV